MRWSREKGLLAVLAGLLFIGISLWSPQKKAPPAPGARAGTHLADFFLRDFTTTTMGPDGRPRNRLSAAAMVHYAADDTSELTEPRFIVFRGEAPPWRIRAGQGRVSAGGETVWLSQDVHVSRHHPDGRFLDLSTSAMRVLPQREYAETDQPVTVASATGVTQAVGMEADLKVEQVRLMAEVRGYYEAP